MFTAIKTFSQVCTHMSIAFGLAYLLTGSLALGGLAAIIEPIINVGLLPWHEKAWHAIRRRHAARRLGFAALAGEKLSQTALHMGVAFSVMYWATGSMAFGGLLAVVEPICNVIVLPFHDRLWEAVRFRVENRRAVPLAALQGPAVNLIFSPKSKDWGRTRRVRPRLLPLTQAVMVAGSSLLQGMLTPFPPTRMAAFAPTAPPAPAALPGAGASHPDHSLP